MKRRAAVFALSVLLLAPAALKAGTGGATLTVTTAAATFGPLDPSLPTAGAPVLLTALVSAGEAWSVSLLYTPGLSAPASLARLRRAQAVTSGGALPLQVNGPGGSWQPLPPGTAVPVASGGATGGQALPLTLMLQAQPTFDLPAGDYAGTLTFLLNGAPVQPTVSLTAQVPPVAQLSPDPRPFTLTRPPDPARPSTIPFEPRLYRILSNVPWQLTATLKGPLQQPGSPLALVPASFAWQPPSGPAQPLLPNQPLTVASGPMTGQAGQTVSLTFTYTVTGLVVAGDYQGEIAVELNPLAASPPAAFKRKSHAQHP
ncbi:MAG: hypothetical protein ACP5VF_03715 [Acidobacteriota bacterium]